MHLPVPSTVSGQTPIVLKLRRQDCDDHSTSRSDAPLGTCRQIEAFPDNTKYKFMQKLVVFT